MKVGFLTMPYKIEKIKLDEKQDRRIKLSSDDKKEIYHLYHDIGGYSLNDLAKIYKVCKKTILLIVNKDSKINNDNYIKNNWKKYYDKDYHTIAIKNTRRYKQNLHLKGEL